MKIVFFEITDWEKVVLQKKLKNHTLKFYSETLTSENASLAKDADVISVFIYSKVNADVLSKLPKLKMITTRSTGFDHIDTVVCKDKNILVCNVPTYGENTVAEHAFALILNLSRNVHKSYLRTQANDFTIEGLKGFDLYGKTIGVVGAGKIGMHVIKIAKGFGMKILAFDVNRDKFLQEVFGFEYVTLDELLASSDIISLHAPYNPHTHHMINKTNIKKIKKGAILINTSRGALVETDALLEALDKKILSGAGLDVIEGEELIKEEKEMLHTKANTSNVQNVLKDHIILRMDNVIFTPHIAFYSQEALERILNTTIDNIVEFNAKNPKNFLKFF